MIRFFVSWFSMKRKHFLFVDIVSGKEVFLYEDYYGDQWMANYFYFGFRVKKENERCLT